jgi:hypothetical protein
MRASMETRSIVTTTAVDFQRWIRVGIGRDVATISAIAYSDTRYTNALASFLRLTF